MNITEAIKDPNLFRPFLADKDDSIKSWRGWIAALRALYGLPLSKSQAQFVKKVSGRNPDQLPKAGFKTGLFLTGRRSGKSRNAAIIAAFEGTLAGHEKKLSKGERGIVATIAPTRKQGAIVKNYIRGIFDTAMFRNEIVRETKEGFELRNGITIEVHTGDFRSARGFSLVAAIVDEVCFFGFDEESKVKSDLELIRALRPSLLTTGGKLIAVSSPYAKRGWAYNTWKECFGNDNALTFVLNCSSRTLNPTLDPKEIERLIAEDPAGNRAELLGEFRDDISAFISRELVESLVVGGRLELLPKTDRTYSAFADLSGGRSDDAALAIAHREDRKVVLDTVRRYKSPHNPYDVIGLMSEELKDFGLNRVTGDRYAAAFVEDAFKANGIKFKPAEKPKSQLYMELLPRLTSHEIELLDQEIIINQLSSLERKTRSGGRDVIDHPPAGHDDCANVVAGVSVGVVAKRRIIGAL